MNQSKCILFYVKHFFQRHFNKRSFLTTYRKQYVIMIIIYLSHRGVFFGNFRRHYMCI